MSSLRKGGYITKGPKTGGDIGLKEFHLRYNRLGAETMRSLSSFLQADEYLRVLDLRGNNIPEDVIRDELIPDLKSNKTLTNLDMRENPGYTIRVRKLTALCLLRNLDRLKKSNITTIEKGWINP
jgi:Ran GTPase-activating protein (RanGAP) involved in mRNA processing and transport